jgi:hypothetical protein
MAMTGTMDSAATTIAANGGMEPAVVPSAGSTFIDTANP